MVLLALSHIIAIKKMNYIQIEFWFTDKSTDESGEILIAMLSELSFESFEETEEGLKAFMPANLYFPDEK